MHQHLKQSRAIRTLPGALVRQVEDSGFATLPGPISGDSFNHLAVAYDEVMSSASGPDYNAGSTTDRMLDLLSHGFAFEEIFLYPMLLEACSHVISAPFKLSSFLARTLRPNAPAQELHVDIQRDSSDAPLLGFILMLDSFREDNGATRFVPTSHLWLELPRDRLPDPRVKFPGEIVCCGERGTLIVFNGAVWHGHTANITSHPRRSIQGYFVRRSARSDFDFQNRLNLEARNRMCKLTRNLLSLEDSPPVADGVATGKAGDA